MCIMRNDLGNFVVDGIYTKPTTLASTQSQEQSKRGGSCIADIVSEGHSERNFMKRLNTLELVL